jgi:N-terminal acetyltransferase 2
MMMGSHLQHTWILSNFNFDGSIWERLRRSDAEKFHHPMMIRLSQRCLRAILRPRQPQSCFSTLIHRPVPSPLLRTPAPLSLRQLSRSPLLQRTFRRTQSTKPVKPESNPEDPSLPVTARLRALFKKYRLPALVVYLGLSVLDFGVAFLFVRALGTERIGHYEKVILRKVEDTFGIKGKGTPPQHLEQKEGASIWTEIALAYTIHKTAFALVRIPLTVAVTPPLVRWFVRNGYGQVLAQVPALGRLFKSHAAKPFESRKVGLK